MQDATVVDKELLDELVEYLRIPSISSGGGDPRDLERAAAWVRERILAAGGSAELADLGGNPISVSYNELVLRDSSGTVVAVDNFGDEWRASGPRWEHAHTIAAQALGSPVRDV